MPIDKQTKYGALEALRSWHVSPGSVLLPGSRQAREAEDVSGKKTLRFKKTAKKQTKNNVLPIGHKL